MTTGIATAERIKHQLVQDLQIHVQEEFVNVEQRMLVLQKTLIRAQQITRLDMIIALAPVLQNVVDNPILVLKVCV